MVCAWWCNNSWLIIWKSHVIDNNAHIFSRKCPTRLSWIKDNWPEGSNFASASTRGWSYFKIDIFAPKFAPQVSTHAHVNFYPEVESFTKNGDKFSWVKYWWMTFNSPNSTKFLHHNFALYSICIFFSDYGICNREIVVCFLMCVLIESFIEFPADPYYELLLWLMIKTYQQYVAVQLHNSS